MMQRILYIFILSILSFKISLAEEIPVIVISPGKALQSIGTVGSDVSVITEKDIKSSSKFFLSDVVSDNVIGTHFSRQGGTGTNSLFQVRGLPKRYTNVYIDGVKMSDPSTPDNSFYFNNLTLNGVKQIEVLKGNQSSLYGSGAIGGTINIYTKTSDSNTLNQNFNIFTGSNNLKNVSLSFDQKINNFDYYFGLNKYITDGISAMSHNDEDDSYRNDNAVLNIGYKINDNLRLENKLRANKSFLNYDTSNENVTDLNDRTKDREFSYVIRLINDNDYLKNFYTYNRYYIKRNVSDNKTTKKNYYGYRDSINYNGEYNFSLDNRIIFGLDNEFEAADFDTWATSSAFESDEAIYSQYFDVQIRPSEKIFATLGARRDSHTTAGDFTTYRFTSAYKPNSSTKFRNSIGTGIRFATLNDYFYDTNVIRKENLKPEKSFSVDFGVEKKLLQDKLIIDTTLFHMEYDDTISGWQSHRASGSGFTIENSSGVVKSTGFEFSASLITETIDKINFGYSFIDAYDGEDCDNPDGSCKDEMPVRIPRNTYMLKLSKDFGVITSTLKGRHQSETRDYGNANNGFAEVILGGYTQVDFSASTEMYGYSLFFDLNNLLDENYQQAYQYSVPGREFNLGFKRNF
tara:strand:- start:3803 stop:5695 length:1893 start_codon:yes stop_codon:yes gene_type:complete